jgi:adenylylsulfate reductase subunit A
VGLQPLTTVGGRLGAGDTIGGFAHGFSPGSFTEGRIAAKAAVGCVSDLGKNQPRVREQEYRDLDNRSSGQLRTTGWAASRSWPAPCHRVISRRSRVFGTLRRS